MALLSRSSAFARVTALASLRPLHEAFSWLHLHGQQMMRWQMELIAIPAPPFGETQRSIWMADRFREAGLAAVTADAIGNVFGELPSRTVSADLTGEAESDDEASTPVIVLSAHLDTVFPAGTVLNPVLTEDRLEAPGACDNAAGVIAMLAIAHALVKTRSGMPNATGNGENGNGTSSAHSPANGFRDRPGISPLELEGGAPRLVFVGNVGEEGEGDLRGIRYLYQHSPYARRIAAHIVLDGAGAETAVTQALGSRRFRVTITGPGGHSFTEAGMPSPILAIAAALAELAQTPVPDEPRTTLNVGTIQGGTSVNTIPESASASIDFRSTDVRQLVRLEVALHRAVEDAVEQANANAALETRLGRAVDAGSGRLRFEIKKIGDRPAAELPANSPLLDHLRAVDRHLGLRTDLRLGSTDANIPLSLNVPAVSLGAGGEGGGAHTLAEWYSDKNRSLGLRRILLLMLAMQEWAAGSQEV